MCWGGNIAKPHSLRRLRLLDIRIFTALKRKSSFFLSLCLTQNITTDTLRSFVSVRHALLHWLDTRRTKTGPTVISHNSFATIWSIMVKQPWNVIFSHWTTICVHYTVNFPVRKLWNSESRISLGAIWLGWLIRNDFKTRLPCRILFIPRRAGSFV